MRRGFAHAHEFTLRNRNADYLVVAAIHGVTANFDFEFGSRPSSIWSQQASASPSSPAGPREWQRAAFDSCGITNGSGKLTDEWRALFARYPRHGALKRGPLLVMAGLVPAIHVFSAQ